MRRPRHLPATPQRRQVEAMAGYGVPEEDIATFINIDPKSLRKHYRRELDTGHGANNRLLVAFVGGRSIRGSKRGTPRQIRGS